MNFNEHTLPHLLNKRQPLLQFYLLKYLKYDDIVKFSLVSKDTGRLCDANSTHTIDSDENEEIYYTLRYLMLVIAV